MAKPKKPVHPPITIEFSSLGLDLTEKVGARERVVGRIKDQFAIRGKCDGREQTTFAEIGLWKSNPKYRALIIDLLLKQMNIA